MKYTEAREIIEAALERLDEKRLPTSYLSRVPRRPTVRKPKPTPTAVKPVQTTKPTVSAPSKTETGATTKPTMTPASKPTGTSSGTNIPLGTASLVASSPQSRNAKPTGSKGAMPAIAEATLNEMAQTNARYMEMGDKIWKATEAYQKGKRGAGRRLKSLLKRDDREGLSGTLYGRGGTKIKNPKKHRDSRPIREAEEPSTPNQFYGDEVLPAKMTPGRRRMLDRANEYWKKPGGLGQAPVIPNPNLLVPSLPNHPGNRPDVPRVPRQPRQAPPMPTIAEAILKGKGARRSILLKRKKEGEEMARERAEMSKHYHQAPATAYLATGMISPEVDPTKKVAKRKSDARGIVAKGSGDFSGATKAVEKNRENAKSIIDVFQRKPHGTKVTVYGKKHGKDTEHTLKISKTRKMGSDVHVIHGTDRVVHLNPSGAGLQVIDAKSRKILLDKGHDAEW